MEFKWDTDFFLRPPFTAPIADPNESAKLQAALDKVRVETQQAMDEVRENAVKLENIRQMDLFEEYAKEMRKQP
jgi:hypothetical protein